MQRRNNADKEQEESTETTTDLRTEATSNTDATEVTTNVAAAQDAVAHGIEQKVPTESDTDTEIQATSNIEKKVVPAEQPAHSKVDESHCDTQHTAAQAMRQMNDAQLSKLVGDGAYNDLTISTWDYGGQKVFYTLHNLFLNREGVYLCVFNLEHLTTKAETYVERSDNDDATDRENYAT